MREAADRRRLLQRAAVAAASLSSFTPVMPAVSSTRTTTLTLPLTEAPSGGGVFTTGAIIDGEVFFRLIVDSGSPLSGSATRV